MSNWLLKRRFLVLLGLLAVTLGLVVANGTNSVSAANLVTNGGFETGNTSSWTVASGDVVHSSGWQSSEGSYSLDLNGFTPRHHHPGHQYRVG